MIRPAAAPARLAALVVLATLLAAGACAQRGREAERPATTAVAPPESLPPLAHLPLDPPIEITASFGEYRRGHFHAGLDFSTGLAVGMPVYAPLDGWVEQVKTSGGGYGRSLRIRSADGRTILFGHLDAYDEPVASWVAAAQESTGSYEQDLAPDPGRFPVRAGQRVAWSGESGAGPAHLHMELRWGDMAYNPLRFGITLPDSHPPILRRATLEPLTPGSYVAGSAGPRTYGLEGAPDTVVAEGKLRVWLEAADGVSNPWPRLAPYGVSLAWEGRVVECRFDRVMWDDDMTAVDWVYDGTARAAPGRAIGLWVAPDYHPAVMVRPARAETSATGGGWGGVLEVAPGDPPRTLTLAARDAGGNRTERSLIVRGPRPGEGGPARRPRRRRAAGAPRFEWMPLSREHVRVSYLGARPASEVRIGWEGSPAAPASFDGARWTAILPARAGAQVVVAAGGEPRWEDRRGLRLAPIAHDAPAEVDGRDGGPGGYLWSLPAGGAFTAGLVTADSIEPAPLVPGLVAAGPAVRIGPARLPLRDTATIALALTPGAPFAERAAVYVERDRRWIYAGAERREGGSVVAAGVRALGRYALYGDADPPRIGAARTRRSARGAPHGRWSLSCALVERGSGVDPARTRFVVDGRPVPSEWDAERGVLRWRPHVAPPAGAHRWEVIATDRSGNAAQGGGTFVVR